MDVAIVGLPASGKTTVFNALTAGHGSATGDGRGEQLVMVKIPDERLDKLAALVSAKKVTPLEVRLFDLPPLFIRGAAPSGGCCDAGRAPGIEPRMTFLAVAAGGALGALARYVIAVRLYGLLGIDFPWGTLGVNVAGCLVLGLVLALVEERGAFGPETRSFLTIGFLGGMTTFSTFIYEGWLFTRDGDILKAGLYAAASLALGFAAFSAGHALSRALER